jgi:hypothetical protein
MTSVLSDRWFTRAWTFHEKHCASTCELLVPLHHTGIAAARLPITRIGNDVCFSFRKIREIASLRTLLNTSDDEPWPLEYRFGLAPFLYEIDRSKPLAHGYLFELLEKCDIYLFSDRLTIFANICNYRCKLNSTLLNNEKYSYSTCILALIMANQLDMGTDAEGLDIWKIDMGRPIKEALRAIGITTDDWNHLG